MKHLNKEQLDDSDEGYLDPNDLSIIDDKTWEPSDEEILSYALKLGYDIENDPDELFEVAYNYLKYPLPEGWRRVIYKETKELMYINMEDGEIEVATEIEELAHQAYLEKKEEYMKKNGKNFLSSNQKDESIGTKVIPMKKIPPINYNKVNNVNSGINTINTFNNLNNNNNNYNNNNLNLNGKKDDNKLSLIEENSFSELDKSKSKEDSFLKIQSKKYDNADINFTDNSEKDNSSNMLNDENINSIFNEKNDIVKRKDVKTITIKRSEENKNEDSNNKTSDISFNKINLEKMKKDYLDKQLNELKEFENKIKKKYCDDKEKYEKEKEEFRQKYNLKLNDEINNKKNKDENEFKNKISSFEKELEKNNKNEIEKFHKVTENDIKKKYEEDNKKSEKKEEEQLNNLKKKKENIVSDIEKIKKVNEINKSKLIEKNDSLRKSKILIDENHEIKKSNILKKYEIEIKEYESNLEEEFLKNKSIIIEKITPNKSINLTNFLEDKNNELYDNYEKVLNEQYEINCKALKQELISNKNKELNNFKESMEIEKKEKINQCENEISHLENEYFDSLNNLRENSKNLYNQTDEILKEKFNNSLINYDIIKKRLLYEDEELIRKFIQKLKELSLKNDNDKNEIIIEEFLYEEKDKINLQLQNHKNSYEILESEYKYKILVMNYLLEILNNIIKNSIDNLNKNVNHEEIIENIFVFAKDKLLTYKFKNSQEKEKKLYPFLKDLKFIKIHRNKSSNNLFYSNAKVENKQIKNKTPIKPKYDINQKVFNNTKLVKKNENLFNKNEKEEEKKKEKEQILLIENKINANKIQYNTIDKNIGIPILTEYYLKNLGYEENKLYNEIISFLKSEYKKVENINKYGTITTYTNLKLNILILDKIKLYTEDTFNFIQKNILSRKNKNYIKEKLELLVEHILDYKKNFLIDENKINKSFNFQNNNINENTNMGNPQITHSYSTTNYFPQNKYQFSSKYSI